MSAACPLCGHRWDQHDPEDGRCDSYATESMGACKCGRDMPYMNRKIAALSKAALAARSDAKVNHNKLIAEAAQAKLRETQRALRWAVTQWAAFSDEDVMENHPDLIDNGVEAALAAARDGDAT